MFQLSENILIEFLDLISPKLFAVKYGKLFVGQPCVSITLVLNYNHKHVNLRNAQAWDNDVFMNTKAELMTQSAESSFVV